MMKPDASQSVRPVVQIVQHLRPGGVESLALDLARLAPEDAPVHVVSLEGGRAAIADWPRLSAFRDRLHFLGKRPGLRPATVLAAARLLRRLRPRAVHTHHIGPLLYGGAAARLAGVARVVHTEHDAWHLGDAARRRTQALALRAVRPTLIADAKTVAAELSRHFPDLAPRVIANGVDVERFFPGTPDDVIAARRRFGLPEDAPLIGCAARLEAVKDHATLLTAFANLAPQTHLALAGDGSLREGLGALARALGVGERVHFLGATDAMAEFYRALDVFSLASKREGMPLSPLEAQAAGAPAVLTDVGGCSETLCPQTGRLVPPGDPKALAGALRKSLTQRLTRSPRDFVLRVADLRRMAAAYQDCYRGEDVTPRFAQGEAPCLTS